MKFLIKTMPALAVSASLVCASNIAEAATEAVLKVRTVEQVAVTQKRTIQMGQIAAAPGYECTVPQRIDISTQAGTNAGTFTVNAITSGNLPPGTNACGTSAPGYFSLKGVPSQRVKVSFSADPSNALGTFKPEGIYKAAVYADVADPLDLTNVAAAGLDNLADAQAVYDDIATHLVQIFDTKEVNLNSTGDGLLAVGGTLKIDGNVDPDTEYSLNYIVNVIYQ
ncbi:hypothetical protein SAMN02745724_01288 [Pseudoalteromonas denitrificans DSM 6059]|uniref:DUF4402 domain-containing protein n=2 Tax=Pseudoalteromonas TaxID=53246 RepID=A0A1I1HY34_9GAMM|nr:hypothetical protein SAMN02745724_01288 [Pseudoalteromonas denitrificans DSM 6059]